MDPVFLEPRYSPAEVGRLVGLSPNTVRQWLGSPATGEGRIVRKPDLTNWASFLDLVEVYIAAELLKRLSISPQRLRRYIREAAERQKIDHPLARRRFLVDGAGKLWAPTPDGFVDLGHGGQLGLVEIVQQVARNIEFDVEGLAQRWFPEGRDGGIVVDPLVSFGRPVLDHTRIGTDVLHDLWLAEGRNTNFVAEIYELDPAAVLRAVRFEEDRRKAA